jgi:hypothetical protein
MEGNFIHREDVYNINRVSVVAAAVFLFSLCTTPPWNLICLGACTSALLNVLYAEHKAPTNDLTWVETLEAMRKNLKSQRYEQIPQLTSSRKIDVNQAVSFTNPQGGTKRAVLIGINYVGQEGQLSGCHNDVGNMKSFLMNVHGFPESNITILMDDGIHTNPTRANILKAYENLAQSSRAGDTCFCHYSGHGGKLRDENGDEDDGYDETLVPVDYGTAGQIRDDDLFQALVSRMPQGVLLTCLMDCCHSGTVLDLPYKYVADGEQTEMSFDGNFDLEKLQQLFNLAKKMHGAFQSGGIQGVLSEICSGKTDLINMCGGLFK